MRTKFYTDIKQIQNKLIDKIDVILIIIGFMHPVVQMIYTNYYVTEGFLNYYKTGLLTKLSILFGYLLSFFGERFFGLHYFFTPLLGAIFGFLFSKFVKKTLSSFAVKKILIAVVIAFLIFEIGTFVYLRIYSNPISTTISSDDLFFEVQKVYMQEDKIKVLFVVPSNLNPDVKVLKWSVKINKRGNIVEPENNNKRLVIFPNIKPPFLLVLNGVMIKKGNSSKEIIINKSIEIKKLIYVDKSI